jgi:hypothetical protein
MGLLINVWISYSSCVQAVNQQVPNVGLRILLIWRVILPRKIRARLTNILEAIVGVLKVFFGYVRDLHEIAKKPNFERMGSMNRNHDALGPSIFEVDVVTTLDS